MIAYLKKCAWIFLLSMVPVTELRAALPLALANEVRPVTAIILTVFGNLFPVPFILLFIRPLFRWMKERKFLKKLVQKLEARAHKKSGGISKSNFWGLVVFVGIPLPGTGAWMGALIAAMLDMRIKHALPAITLGVFIASILITAAYYLVASGIAPFLGWMLG